MIFIAFIIFFATIIFYRKLNPSGAVQILQWPDLKLFIAVCSKDHEYATFAGSLSCFIKAKKVEFKMMVIPTSSAPNFFQDFKNICVDTEHQFALLIDIRDDGAFFNGISKRLYIQTRVVDGTGEVVDACIDEVSFDINNENSFWRNYTQRYISRLKLIRDKTNKIIALRLNR